MVKTKILPDKVKTDHKPIDIIITFENFVKRGPGFWKFNNQLLYDNEYTRQVKQLISDLKVNYHTLEDKGLKWDIIKCEIRGFTVKYSKNRSRCIKKNISNLEKEQIKLTDLLNNSPQDENILKCLNDVHNELEQINNEVTKGSIIRSRAIWSEEGEKNSKYFLGLEKRNYKNKCISKLINDNGKEITDHDQILKMEKEFYEELFKSKSINNLNTDESKELFFKEEDITKLNEDQKEECEGIIRMDECVNALKCMKNGKTPGLDGYHCEVYNFFWQDIKYLVLDSINYAYHSGSLSIDQRRGIITLTPKSGKDRTLLKSWRPISLLNTDYKIIAKSLANRLKPNLPLLIHPDQTGFVKNRYIGENCRLIGDILHLACKKQISGFLLLVDFQKAYDSVEWKYIEKILPLFNLGESFKKWVKILYFDSESTVTNNFSN